MSREVRQSKDDWELRIDLTKSVGGGEGVTDWWYENIITWWYPETLSLCATTMRELFAIPGKCKVITAVLSKKPHPEAYPLRIIKAPSDKHGVSVLLAYKEKEEGYYSTYERMIKHQLGTQPEIHEPGGGWWHLIISLAAQKILLKDVLKIEEVAYFRVEIDE